MSHFTVLVQARNRQELEEKLLPFHEYECTGIKQYIEFVPAEENIQEEYQTGTTHDGQKFSELYESIEEFAEDWYGYKLKNGVYGRTTNPNAKWDWWVIGGRWTGGLILKDENAWSGVGKPGLMTEHSGNPLEVDYAPKGALDWEAMGDFQTFAFINREGKWIDKEDMGWWGFSSPNENTEEYDLQFKEFIASLGDSDILWLVDCHI